MKFYLRDFLVQGTLNESSEPNKRWKVSRVPKVSRKIRRLISLWMPFNGLRAFEWRSRLSSSVHNPFRKSSKISTLVLVNRMRLIFRSFGNSKAHKIDWVRFKIQQGKQQQVKSFPTRESFPCYLMSVKGNGWRWSGRETPLFPSTSAVLGASKQRKSYSPSSKLSQHKSAGVIF